MEVIIVVATVETAPHFHEQQREPTSDPETWKKRIAVGRKKEGMGRAGTKTERNHRPAYLEFLPQTFTVFLLHDLGGFRYCQSVHMLGPAS